MKHSRPAARDKAAQKFNVSFNDLAGIVSTTARRRPTPILLSFQVALMHPAHYRKEGRKFTHPWQPTKLNEWDSVCVLGQILGFMHRSSLMPQSSIHVDILKDNIFAAQWHPRCGNWGAGVMKQYAGLGMPSPFSSSGITALNSLGFLANMEGQHRKVWDGLHVSRGLAPSKGAKLCTYFAWFFHPSQLHFEPYLDIPMSISRLR